MVSKAKDRVEQRPKMTKVPAIITRPVPELPDDHLLRCLAYLAGSRKGLSPVYERLTRLQPMVRYRPILTKLQADTRPLHRTRKKVDAQRARELTDIALVDLACACTPTDLTAGSMRDRILERR
ncbi:MULTISPECIES: hypothetical protein [unclassified Rhodococcus (in: high G+C Gram-positive bacteria)]|uniref:hypothetical protein n=1 Tax=unclassified Rhodococcus (in: high G+C Gram-positive bacteria) TaxID=192944 RepID=UPI00117B06F0|nr:MULTISPECIES: hypothetical protein [unclassified Rhodococcus (in: high G+C Gram-positive bacteria)]